MQRTSRPRWRTERRCARRGGFSLIELLTVMLVIGVLGGLAIPAYSTVQRRFYDTTALSDVVNAGKALAGLDGPIAFSQTVRGPGAVRLVPGAMVSDGTTLLLKRTIGLDGTVTYLVRGTHAKGSGTVFFFDNGQVYAQPAQL
jgi:prepilin-type N-terminal cleavage/methylation domain-containing protein